MSSSVLVSVEEYLRTPYRPDCDYVDGQVLDRNLGEFDHSRLQLLLAAFFHSLETKLGICPMVEQRVQVSPSRFRVPDVCVTLGRPGEKILTRPPFLCVEILSPEDRMSRTLDKIRDYLDFGVSYVWVIDPETRTAQIYTAEGSHEIRDGMLRTTHPEIAVSLAELFAAL